MSALIKNYTEYQFLQRYRILDENQRILNAGSSSVRYGKNCVNVDIQDKENVDIVCDIHDLPDSLGKFDVIICNAVLQYCVYPHKVAKEFYRILKPGGYIFVDAPWVQPSCQDTPDKHRYSEDALRLIFQNFEIIEIGPSIRPGSAFFMMGVQMAQNMTRNKYINYMLGVVVKIILFAFRGVRTAEEKMFAGAFYMICRKV